MTGKYCFNQPVSLEENTEIEFKGFEKIHEKDHLNRVSDYTKQYVTAFLNSNGGTLYLGIEDDGRVTGVLLNRKQRDDFLKRIDQTIGQIYPKVEPFLYDIQFYVVEGNGSDRYVIEIHVKPGIENVYSVSRDELEPYIRTAGGKSKMPLEMIIRRIQNGRPEIGMNKVPTDENHLEPLMIQSPEKISAPSSLDRPQSFFTSRKSVTIQCEMPIVLGRGSMEIRLSCFAHRNHVIHFPHDEILKYLMPGLQTPLEWSSRRFIEEANEGIYLLKLNNDSSLLTKEEATDLCECVDEICIKYRQALVDAEHTLESLDFPLLRENGFYGFEILYIHKELWELMYRFSNEFDSNQGSSVWHCFSKQHQTIRVANGIYDHAFLWPKTSIIPWPDESSQTISIVYETSSLDHLWSYRKDERWQESVGEKELWTVLHTYDWVKNKFIPHVINYYAGNSQFERNRLLKGIEDPYTPKTPIKHIENLKQLETYIVAIQEWLYGPERSVQANLMVPYYEALIQVIKKGNSRLYDYPYIQVNLLAVEHMEGEIKHSSVQDLPTILEIIDQHVVRVKRRGFDNSRYADFISRVFLSCLDHVKDNRITQIDINKAKQAIAPTYEVCAFESRHIIYG